VTPVRPTSSSSVSSKRTHHEEAIEEELIKPVSPNVTQYSHDFESSGPDESIAEEMESETEEMSEHLPQSDPEALETLSQQGQEDNYASSRESLKNEQSDTESIASEWRTQIQQEFRDHKAPDFSTMAAQLIEQYLNKVLIQL
jgi:hypothetical protein